jgi:hypothetical protein
MFTLLKITLQFPKQGSLLSNVFASTGVSPTACAIIGIFDIISWRASPEVQLFGGPSLNLLL